MGVDLRNLHLEWLVHEDKKQEDVVEALRRWNGPMPEDVVHRLAEYFDPNRPRKTGPKSGRPAGYGAEDLIMNHYFHALSEGNSNPIDGPDKIFDFSRRTFESIRSRYNKNMAESFRELRSLTSDHPDIIAAYLCDRHHIPKEYWEKNILPLSR